MRGKSSYIDIFSHVFCVLKDFIWNNQLSIDKGTYFTILIGQVTIYGILLTFYQFIVSFQENERAAVKYLGYDIAEYFAYKHTWIFNKVISTILFNVLFVLEIIYVPIVKIYCDFIPIKWISFMNFLWYTYVILYFGAFIWLVLQCTQTLLRFKRESDIYVNNGLAWDINNMFLNTVSRKKKTNTDILQENLNNLRNAIEFDNNPNLQKRYNELISEIFSIYIEQKERDVSKNEEFDFFLNYKLNIEKCIILEILEGHFFKIDEENIIHIFDFQLKLLKLNLQGASNAGYEIVYNRVPTLLHKKSKVLDITEWEWITHKIYIEIPDKKKEHGIQKLYDGMKQEPYQEYYEECIIDVLREEILEICEGKRKQKDFIEIYRWILNDKIINDICTDIIRDSIVYYQRVDFEEIVGHLDKTNCTFLFAYIIIYYSIYRFHSEWKYINLKLLKLLWKRKGGLNKDVDIIVEKMKTSHMGHRFEREMYTKLEEYICAKNDRNLIDTVVNDKKLDVFYIWVVKTCIMEQRSQMYREDFEIDAKVYIINEISKHEELMENEYIEEWVQCMRYRTFSKQKNVPANLKITLRGLLLTDLDEKVVSDYVTSDQYIYRECIGEYLLIKIQKLQNKSSRQKELKETIRRAYISSNMEINEYIESLEKECKICKYELSKVQKEKMKENLLKTF